MNETTNDVPLHYFYLLLLPSSLPSYLFSYVVQVVSSSMRSHPLDFFVFLASTSFYSRNNWKWPVIEST